MTLRWVSGMYLDRSVPIDGKYSPTHASNTCVESAPNRVSPRLALPPNTPRPETAVGYQMSLMYHAQRHRIGSETDQERRDDCSQGSASHCGHAHRDCSCRQHSRRRLLNLNAHQPTQISSPQTGTTLNRFSGKSDARLVGARTQ
eukprot:3497625-Rhodomonas_salina.3